MKDTEAAMTRMYRFGDVVIDCARFCTIRNGQSEKITPRAFEVLLYLIEHRDRVVEKQELFAQVWKASFVSDNALTRMIKEIRQVLGDEADAPRYIETVHRRGYRFIAELKDESPTGVPTRAPAFSSIAVLPFANLSGDPESDYLSDGIAESIINLLSSLPSLRVAPRSSSFRYKGQDAALEAGRDLGVRAVLSGRVLHHSQMLIVKTELIDVAEDRQLWGEQYQQPFSDIFALQSEIARDISAKLQVKLTGEDQQRLTRRYEMNSEAYRLYLKGRYFWNRRPGGLEKAIRYFEQSLELMPNCALTWSGLADCYSTLGSWEDGSVPPGDVMPLALAAATKALELDSELAEAHASLAYIKIHYDWDWEGAEQECREAIRLKPDFAGAHHWYSHLLVTQGRFAESLAASQRCLSLDHLDLIHNNHLGWHFYHARQYDAALAQHLKTLELDPHSVWPNCELGRTYEQKQMFAEAIESFIQASKMTSSSFPVAGLGHVYGKAGQREKALEQLAILKQRAQKAYVSSYSLALIHIGLGEHELALDLLEQAYSERSGWMAYLGVDPRLDPLRTESRFHALLSRLELA
ncbi:MAG: winged helix-turn-helix domain-containing protein [Acidobacteria bacterium]|nr:winged helix-turn-helix domain-containing protein [Acidobacteriota bacterium]